MNSVGNLATCVVLLCLHAYPHKVTCTRCMNMLSLSVGHSACSSKMPLSGGVGSGNIISTLILRYCVWFLVCGNYILSTFDICENIMCVLIVCIVSYRASVGQLTTWVTCITLGLHYITLHYIRMCSRVSVRLLYNVTFFSCILD